MCDSASEWPVLLARELFLTSSLRRDASFSCHASASIRKRFRNDFEATISSKLWPNCRRRFSPCKQKKGRTNCVFLRIYIQFLEVPFEEMESV